MNELIRKAEMSPAVSQAEALTPNTEPQWNVPPGCPIPYEDGELLYSSHELDWSGTHLYIYRLFQDTIPRPVFGPQDTVVLHLQNPVKLQRRFEGGWQRGLSAPGGLCINPKEAATTYIWKGSPICAAFTISPTLMASLVDEIGKTDPAHVEIIESFNFRDPFMEHAVRTLVNEVKTAELGGQGLADSLSKSLGLYLLKKYSTLTVVRILPTRKLSEREMQRVDEYIYAFLAERITVAELASTIGLTASYFDRLLKATTGMTPIILNGYWASPPEWCSVMASTPINPTKNFKLQPLSGRSADCR
jgi:hypothetical protein